MKHLLTILVLSLTLFACKSTKKAVSSKETNPVTDTLITIEQTPCYGKCPVYNMVIFTDGKVVYHGKMNVSKIGTYQKSIPETDIHSLINAFEKADFWSFKDKYTSPVTDLPTTYIRFTNKKKSKKIEDYYNAPKALKNLEDMVIKIANSDNWKKMTEPK